MAASSLSVISKHIITDKITISTKMQLLPVLNFTLLIQFTEVFTQVLCIVRDSGCWPVLKYRISSVIRRSFFPSKTVPQI